MSQEQWFSRGGQRVREALDGAFGWCERFSLVTDCPAPGQRGGGFWAHVEGSVQRLGAVILSTEPTGELESVAVIQRAGHLRRLADGRGPLGHFVWFERGDDIRFMLAASGLRADTVEGPGLWFYWGGPKAELPEGLQSMFDACWSSSIPVAPDEVVTTRSEPPQVAPHSRPILSVREVLGIRSTVDFLELEAEDQERALWSALLGEGPVDLEQAVRLCAERLRAQGFLDYQALRQEGRIYAAVEERLLSARRATELFDRPRNGFVRAIQPDIDEVTAEQWRDCLLGALDVGARVDREQAVRMGFTRAQDVYGVNAQRLRAGGRADQALRSAINSSVRQGFLARDGAAYVIRVSPLAPPTLRGVRAVEPELERAPDANAEIERGLLAPAPAAEPLEVTVREDVPPQEEEVDRTTEALTAGGATGWAELTASLTDDQRALALVDLDLPARMTTFVRAEGFQTLGDLFRLSHEDLTARPNLGRKSLNDTLDAVRDFLSERGSPTVYTTFLQGWQAQLSALEPVARMIVTRRAGMHGTRETLEELGGMLGVTRERVRQIEARVVERLSEHSRWRRTVEANIAVAFGAGRALPLRLLAEDPWWAGIDQHELLLDYVVRRIFENELFLLTAPSSKRYLAKFPPAAFEEHLESARSRLAKLEYPIETAGIDAILHSEVDALDPILFPEFEVALGELLHLDPERPGIAVGYGRYRDDEVLAFLNSQPEPVPVGLVEERLGRGRLPEEVLYFKRGVVGLKRHFPDFDAWTVRLVPVALEVMKERPLGRQWLVPELHDALRERGLVPEWLGHWHLASLLRLSGQVDYLGRLRVAAKDSSHDERLQYETYLEQILQEAGGPIDFTELLARARVRTDLTEAGASSTTLAAPFVRLDESRVGLVERDIPGGPQAVAAAIEAVLQALTSTQRGLTAHQATELVTGLSDVHTTWSRQLVMSVLRSEVTVRIDRSKNIGLDEWDDVRCPARAEFIRREVQRAGGRLSLSDIAAKLESFYGRAPDRSQLGVLVSQVGLTIADNDVVQPEEASAVAPASRPGIDLGGIPVELREMFEELLRQPLTDLDGLRAQIREHVAEIEQEHRVNEFVDLRGARQLAQQAEGLLDRWESLRTSERHLAHAAVRYFVSWNDVENDLNIGGLDDDKQIMNAVLSYLGIHEHVDDALAS